MTTSNNTISAGQFSVDLKSGKDKKKFQLRLDLLSMSHRWPEVEELLINLHQVGSIIDIDIINKLEAITNRSVGYIVKSVGYSPSKPKYTLQLRLGSIPIKVFGPASKTSDFIDLITTLVGYGIGQPIVTKTDTPAWKPQTILQYMESSVLPEYESVPSYYTEKYYNIGTGIKTVHTIQQQLKKVAELNTHLYTDDEQKQILQFSESVILTHYDLRREYGNLLSHTNRPNEIHKNFGELYVAMFLSFSYRCYSVHVPSSGTSPVHDILLVSTQDVIEISVKDYESGANCSAPMYLKNIKYCDTLPQTAKDFIYLINLCSQHLRHIEYDNDSSLHTMCMGVLNSVYPWKKLAPYFDDMGYVYDKNPKKIKTSVLMKLLTKNVSVGRQMFNSQIVPHIDLDQYLLNVKVNTAGHVFLCEYNPDKLTYTGPKKPGENCTISLKNLTPSNEVLN